MKDYTTYVAMDTHKKEIVGATHFPDGRPIRMWTVPNEEQSVKRMMRKIIKQAPDEVACCYEAGPCGFTIYRWVRSLGASCSVIAPSLIYRKPGERIKTDPRDTRNMLQQFRWGLLTEVVPPSREEEAVRSLTRCREQVRADLMRCRHRLLKFLDQRAFGYHQGAHWTQRHYQWIRGLEFEREADRVVWADYLMAVEHLEERKRFLDAQIEGIAQTPPYAEAVGILRCFRGIDTTTAMIFLAELYAFNRFLHPRQVMAFLGMIPSERSSGEQRRLGKMTKTGNRHVRRILIEAAQHYRYLPRVGAGLRKRREGQPQEAVALADKAMVRLYRRYRHLKRHGKRENVAIAALARELAGFLWGALQGTMAKASSSGAPAEASSACVAGAAS